MTILTTLPFSTSRIWYPETPSAPGLDALDQVARTRVMATAVDGLRTLLGGFVAETFLPEAFVFAETKLEYFPVPSAFLAATAIR